MLYLKIKLVKMSLLKMIHRTTGTYKTTTVAGESVKAFVPYPLPPENPKIELTDSLKHWLDQAERALKNLNLAGTLVPSLDWFIYAFVRKEAVTSSQIEGTQATLIDLLTFEAEENQNQNPDADLEEICNYLDAIKYARGQLNDTKGLPLSMRLLNAAHKHLMHGVRGGTKQPGAIRQSQNWIGGTRPGKARFVPPPPQDLAQLIGDLEKYIHTEDSLPNLIRIGLLHVQFETIHPYLDGNGRIGRLLITLLLEHWKLLDQPLVYLSLYFKRHRDQYYHHLELVRTEGNWEAWTEFFLKGVCEICEEATKLIGHLVQIVTEDRAKVIKEASSSLYTLKLFELLPTHPVITMPKVVALLDTTKPTAMKAIATLEKLKILKEKSGRKRDRIFEYVDYTGKLKFGTELKMYRIVINYAFEDFVIKDGAAEYAIHAGYDFFYDTLAAAESDYKKIIKKLKNKPSMRGAQLEVYDSYFNKWDLLQASALWPKSDKDIPARQASDVGDNKLDLLQTILKKLKLNDMPQLKIRPKRRHG
jgi:Fic family protein